MDETRGDQGEFKNNAKLKQKHGVAKSTVSCQEGELSVFGREVVLPASDAHTGGPALGQLTGVAMLEGLRREDHGEHALLVQQRRGDHTYSHFESPGEALTTSNGGRGPLDRGEAGEENQDQGQEGSLPRSQDHLMEKYLVSASLRAGRWDEDSLEHYSLLGEGEDYGYWRDCEDLVGSVSLGSESSDPDRSAEESDLGKALLVQQCRDLGSQLEESERQLEALRLEARGSAERERKERQGAMEALESVRRHLEAEREQRMRCEELVRRGTREAGDLRAELDFLRCRLDRKQRAGEDAAGLISELREEKELVLVQLRGQEQLVRDIQEQKLAGDSVSSEVQALFGHQLSVLQGQRDRLQGMLDAQQAQNLTASELLGQRTLELDSRLEELRLLQVRLAERDEGARRLDEEKRELESRLLCLQESLASTERAASQAAEERMVQENHVAELEIRAKEAEEALDVVREEFQIQLQEKDLKLQVLMVERETSESEHQEKESALQTELESVKDSVREQDRVHTVAMETLLQNEAEKLNSIVEEAVARLNPVHLEETWRLQEKHQEQVNGLKEEMQRQQEELKSALEEEQRNRIALIKQVHEREHRREMAELVTQREVELGRLEAELKESLETAHQTELMQAQTQHALELEALRLSLTNQHAAQLELSQNALQRHEEEALSEQRDNLCTGWSRDTAQLREQHRAELERVREENQDQARRVQRQHQQETDDLKHTWQTQLLKETVRMEEEQARQTEVLRAEWQRESDRALEELRSCLQEAQGALAASRAQLEEARASRGAELQRLEEELSRARSDRDNAARVNVGLVTGHQGAVQELQNHIRRLEEIRNASAEREQQLQQQVERLQAEQVTLKCSSEQEVGQLRAQLESVEVSHQELEGLREQLQVRSARAEETEEEEERMKRQLSRQREELQEQKDLELQDLRAHFEQRLRVVEDGHREEVALLRHQLARRPAEPPAPQEGNVSFLSEGDVDEEKGDMLAEINLKLENHKEELDTLRLRLEERHTQELDHLKASLALLHREELLLVKTRLADRYFSQIQELKSQHARELEQQRAKLSENHAKEVSRLRLQSAQDAARQVEREVEDRSRALAEELRSERALARSLQAQLEALLRGRDQQLRQAEVQHEELLKKAREKLKQDFEEQLRVEVLKARAQEEAWARREEEGLSKLRAELQEKREELGRVRAELQVQEEARISALREELGRVRTELQVKEEARISALREEQERAATEERRTLQEEVRRLQEQLQEEARSPRDSPGSERDPRLLAARQRMEAQFQRELLTAKQLLADEVKELNTVLLEQGEAKLQEAQRRFEELEEKLRQEQETAICELNRKHGEELQSQKAVLEERERSLQCLEAELRCLEEGLKCKHGVALESLRAEAQAKHKAELESLKAELESLESVLQARHKAELESLEAELRQRSHAQLEAREAELRAELKRDQDELEARMLSNMDSLESAYLEEIQTVRGERDATLLALRDKDRGQAERDGALLVLRGQERGHTAQLERLKTHHQAQLGLICIELRRELDRVLMDSLTPPGQELNAGTSCLEEEEGEGEETKQVKKPELEEEVVEKEQGEETLFVDAGGLPPELGDLFSKLKTDLRTAAEQKRGLQEALGQLQKVLLEVVRRTLATEEEIQRRLRAHGESGVRLGGEVRKVLAVLREDCSGLAQSLLSGLGLQPRVEGAMLGASAYSSSAVHQLLDLLYPQKAQVALEEQSREDSGLSLLHLDLHKGPAELSSEEKAALEEVLLQKEVELQELREELEGQEAELREKEAELQELREERVLLLRLKQTLTQPLGDTEMALLEEAQRLLQEKAEVQRQAERDWSRLASRLRLMEQEVEERDSSWAEEERQHKAQLEDLRLQIQAQEKQLRHHRQFIDEQAVEREQEREDFQQEIRSLELQLKRPSKPPAGDGEDKVDSLQAALREKTEECARLLLSREEYRAGLAEQNEQIHKMAARICELEQAPSASSPSSPAPEQQGGEQDRESFQQLLCPSCQQMYALQGNPDHPCPWPPRSGPDPSPSEQLEALQAELHSAGVEKELKEQTADLEEPSLWNSTNQNLVRDPDSCRHPQPGVQKDSSLELQDPQTQLEQVQQEVCQLSEEVLRLQQEAEASKGKVVEEVEELRSQVEHLLSDRARFRQDREEEVERLHEVIHKLQEELEQMGPVRHELSSSPEGSLASVLTHVPPLLPHTPRGLRDSLCLELSCQTPIPNPFNPVSQPGGDLSPNPPGEEALERAGHIWAEEMGGLQRQKEVEPVDEWWQHNTVLQGAEPMVRRAAEGQEEEADPGPGGEGEQRPGGEVLNEPVSPQTLRNLLKTLEAQLCECQAQIHTLQMENEGLRQAKIQFQQEVGRLRQEVTSQRAHIPQLNSQLRERMTGAEGLREVLTFAEETLARAERALRENQERLEQGEEEHDALKAEHEYVKAELDSLKAEHETVQEELDALKVEHEAVKAELDCLKAEHEAVKAELDCLKAEHEALKEEHEAVKAELDCLKAEHDVLRAEHTSFKMKFVAVQDDLRPPLTPSTSASTAWDPPQPPEACSTPRTPPTSEDLCSLGSEQVTALDERYFTGLEEWPSEGNSSSEGASLDGDATLQEQVGAVQGLSASFLHYLHTRDMALEERTDSATESVGQDPELLSPELQGLLKRVYNEGHRVLSLSERPVPVAATTPGLPEAPPPSPPQAPPPSPPQAPPPGWQAERRALQQAVLSLRELLCKMAARHPQPDSGETERAAQPDSGEADLCSVLRSERAAWSSEMRAVLSSTGAQQLTALTGQLEKLLTQQEAQQRQGLEQLLSTDRAALQEEVQAVRSLLSSSSLQTQEQLRLLQASVCASSLCTSSQHSHGELLEPCLTERLLEETGWHGDQRAEPTGTAEQTVQLEEGHHLRTLHSCDASLQTLQEEALFLEEQAARREEVQQERQSEKRRASEALKRLEEREHHASSWIEVQRKRDELKQLEGEMQRKQEELQEQGEEAQRRHKVALEQLKEEVQRKQEVLKQLEKEVLRRREVLKQLEDDVKIKQKEVLELLEEREHHACSLKEAQRRWEELKEQEKEAQRRWEELKEQEKEVQRKQEELKEQEKEVQRKQEELKEQEKEVQRKQEKLKEQEKEVQRKQEELKEQEKGVQRKQEELKEQEKGVQRKQEELKEQEKGVQRKQEELKEQEKEVQRKQEVQKQLENERAQYNPSLEKEAEARSEREEAATQDRRFMEELRAQLEQERGRSEELAAAAERLTRQAITAQRALEEEARRRNEEVARSEREAALRLQALRLENALLVEEERRRAERLQAQRDLLREEVRRRAARQEELEEQEEKLRRLVQAPDCVSLSEQLFWKKKMMQSNAETELQLTADITEQPFNSKMRRLYCKFLRAESYRKALVFQKRYLLLLLGGVQDGEQTTLAVIARMGACPSPVAPLPRTDPTSCFRTAALAVIAVVRLSLLVRKWRRAFRGVPSITARTRETSPRPGEASPSPGAGEISLSRGAGSGSGAKGLSFQRPPVLQSSLPTRDAQPRSTGRGHSSAPVHHVTLQPIQQVHLHNFSQKSNCKI